MPVRRQCADCGFAYPTTWFEEVEPTTPPRWWTFPFWMWKPVKSWVYHVYCTACGRKEEHDA
jgi:hypothetical protein